MWDPQKHGFQTLRSELDDLGVPASIGTRLGMHQNHHTGARLHRLWWQHVTLKGEITRSSSISAHFLF